MNWPTTLPDDLLQRGFQESAPNTVLRTQMDAGPAKLRRRFTAGVRPVSGLLYLTAAQVEILDGFYLNDCAGGALPFDWTHPRTGDAVTLRFVDPPAYASADGDYEAALSLEIVP